MEWSFECSGGTVTVRQEGERVVCQALGRPESQGLYKAWLLGEEGKALLGTLIPENGALRLRRNMSAFTLKEKGAWPPVGAEIVMAYAFTPEEPPSSQWCWTECPCRLFTDRVISHALRGVDRALFPGRSLCSRLSLSYPAPFLSGADRKDGGAVVYPLPIFPARRAGTFA